MFNTPAGVAGGIVLPRLEFIYNAVDNSDKTVSPGIYTFTDVPCGTPEAGSSIIACFGARGTGGTNPGMPNDGVTIDGIEATHIAKTAAANENIANMSGIVDTGNNILTCDMSVAINFASGTVQRCGLGVWRLRNGASSVAVNDVQTINTQVVNPSVTVDVLAGGGLAGYGGYTSDPGNSWTNLIERFNQAYEIGEHSGADEINLAADPAYSVMWNTTYAGGSPLIVASWAL